ncbi:hypothetical protein ACFQQB_45680 [Nonomuraea rubra]|uniref:hypothetical protein n=1 Tax=Nonomuraea rubra TaxID=46180 RepID=UPI00360D50F1
MTSLPLASRPCAWRLWAAPLRWASTAGSVSRSSTVTWANRRCRAAADSRPAMLAPMTTAWSIWIPPVKSF